MAIKFPAVGTAGRQRIKYVYNLSDRPLCNNVQEEQKKGYFLLF